MYHRIKQLEEKQVVIEVDLMVWSDRLDLVAFSNTKGELALHRITWTKAWSLPPPSEGSLITALAWRPDGKVIAVAYDTKELFLINVENKQILHNIETRAGITCLLWAQEKGSSTTNLLEEPTMKYADDSSNFIADPPSLSNYSSNVVDDPWTSKFFQHQSELNFLFIGTDNGSVLFSTFGSLPLIEIDLTYYLQKKASPFEAISCRIHKLHTTDDLSRLFVTLEDTENDLKMVILNTKIFKSHSDELFAISIKEEKINGLIRYLTASIATLEEIWEGILLGMDENLSKYASRVPQGTLSVDFLDLLMFGIYSNEMESFLLKELTLKGLEKFGNSIESSYANMQVMLFSHFKKAGRNICYHLNDLHGFARLEHRFQILGLKEDTVAAAIQAIGALLLKSGEMLLILDDTLVNSRAFIRWLTVATLQLMDDSVPTELQKRTQIDILCIADFLKNFDNISSDNNTSLGGKNHDGFILERLGQYLTDASLSIKMDFSTNIWDDFLKKNPCIKNNAAIIEHMPSLSLIQQHKHLKLAIAYIYKDCMDALTKQINPIQTIHCCHLGEVQNPFSGNKLLQMTQINFGDNKVLHAFRTESDKSGFYLVHTDLADVKKITARALYLLLSENSENNSSESQELKNVTTVTDLAFYSSTVLSLLLRKQNAQQTTGVLCQFPIKFVQDKFGDNLDLAREDLAITEQNIVRISSNELPYNNDLIGHVLDMAPRLLAVSGARKVAIVLGTNRRSIRIYEMEAEDEDEDDDDEEDKTVDDELQHQDDDGDCKLRDVKKEMGSDEIKMEAEDDDESLEEEQQKQID